jgi:hypothetical protein
MPGGVGTLEEIFEAWTWGQLGFHHKPVAFYDIDNYYSDLISFIQTMKEQEFINRRHVDMILIESDPVVLITALQSYRPPPLKTYNNN